MTIRAAPAAALRDDATRVVQHAAFAYSENADSFLSVLRRAVLKRGLPVRPYCDNGAAFRSQQLELVCAQLGVNLIHARAYRPAGNSTRPWYAPGRDY